MYALSQHYPIFLDMVEGFLHVSEKYLGSGEVNFHRAQLAQDQVPLIHANQIFIVGYIGEDLLEVVLLLWGKQQHHVDCVNHPPQDNLAGLPGAVSCIHILQGRDFLVIRRVVGVQGLDHLVKCVGQGAPDVALPLGSPLG